MRSPQELKKLRNLDDPEVNKILIDSISDPDIRVKVKAVDLLGARQANEGVSPISQLLFLDVPPSRSSNCMRPPHWDVSAMLAGRSP